VDKRRPLDACLPAFRYLGRVLTLHICSSKRVRDHILPLTGSACPVARSAGETVGCRRSQGRALERGRRLATPGTL